MKVIDSSFQEVKDSENSYSNTYNQVIDFLKTRVNDEQLLSQLIANCDHSILQLTDGKTYTILSHDGQFKRYNYPSSAAAFKTNIAISSKENEVLIIPGIALRPNYNNHQLVHELLHVITTNQHNYFNENGVVYTKTGTRIDYYDRELNNYYIENNPSSDGLNEGITEYLATIITNECVGNYPHYHVIASILMACNDKLLNAYLSNDVKSLELFYEDLENKQSVISREDLCKLETENLSDEELAKIIVGGLKYNKAYNNEVDISWITNYLDKYYMLNSGSWSDLITSSLEKYEGNNSMLPKNR